MKDPNYPDNIRDFDDDPRSPFYKKNPKKDADYWEEKADADYERQQEEKMERERERRGGG